MEIRRAGARLGLAITLLALASPALARPRIEISMAQAKEVVSVTGAVKTATLVPIQTASPGDVVQYTLTYANKGDEVARDAVIDDPVPKGTTFVAGSATTEGAEVVYSADGGKTFAPAAQLTREVRLPSGEVERRAVPPGEYTHLRWIFRAIPPGATGSVSFRVRVD
jgi:uncharacterized repeat protein (TIGR01451 family)